MMPTEDEMIDGLTYENESLKASLEVATKDTNRINWMAVNPNYSFEMNRFGQWVVLYFNGVDETTKVCQGGSIRAAIDASMEHEKKNK